MFAANPPGAKESPPRERRFIPDEELRARLARLQAAMADEELDALLLYGAQRRAGNLTYLTRTLPGAGDAIAVVPRRGPVELISQTVKEAPGGSRPEAAGVWRPPLSVNLRAVPGSREAGGAPAAPASLGEAAAAAAQTLGASVLGLVGVEEQMRGEDAMVLQAALPRATLRTLTDWYEALRAPKGEPELRLLRRAADLCWEACQHFADLVTRESSLRKIGAEVERVIYREGAEAVCLLVTLPERAAAAGQALRLQPAPPTHLVFAEAVIAYIAVSYQGYWADRAQALPMVPVEPRGKEVRARAESALDALLALFAVGKPLSEFTEEAARQLRLALGPYPRADFPLGNGIGLDLQEWPLLGSPPRSAGSRLRENMILSLRLGIPAAGDSAFVSRMVWLHRSGVHQLYPRF